MKSLSWLSLVAVAACLVLGGCGKKEIDTSEVEKAIRSVAPAQATPTDPGRQMADQALSAIKEKNYEGGAAALQALRSNPTLNADQLTAAQDAMAA